MSRNATKMMLLMALGVIGVASVGYLQFVMADRGPHQTVDLDTFIAEQRPHVEGTKSIFVPTPIAFEATLMRQPEKIKVEYLYTAYAAMNVDPVPEVSHQMFVASPDGTVISVYVEDKLVPAINRDMEVDDTATFKGNHVYNYARGPAIVVESIE